MESKLIGIRTFATGYEALIYTEDLSYAENADNLDATIDDIVIFVGRQTEQDKEAQR